MKSKDKKDTLLSGLRALDLTTEAGFFCGKILGDFGVDVIKVEPPGGSPSRNIGPFYDDIPDPEKSLNWLAFNTSKRGITINIELAQGQELFRELAKRSDFVIESFPPGYLDSLGLGYPELSKINPHTIMTSITPFGQTGPYSHYKGGDIVAMAMGGIMVVTGDADRPPVVMALEQACKQAGAHAAAGTMLAYHYRVLTGEGQHVDVSIQESALRLNYRDPVAWEVEGIKGKRQGNYYFRGALRTHQIWRCKDGFVGWFTFGGLWGAKDWNALTEWADSEGMAGILSTVDWAAMDLSTITQEEMDAREAQVVKFFLRHTKLELEEGALKRGIRLNAVKDLREVTQSRQLSARGFWTQIKHPELGATITYPGHFFLSDRTSVRVRRRAPLIGEHNEEIYRIELGLSRQRLAELRGANVI